MLSSLISASIRGRVVVVALCALLIGYGLRTAGNAPLDVFPEFAPPKVEIQTEAPGLSTEEVESLISLPLENALNGTPGMKTLRSKSVLGLSSVVVLFEEGYDLHKARQYVQERVAAEAVRLPTVARPPVILQPLSSLSRVMKIGVSSKTVSQRDMTVLAMFTIRPKLMAVPGVANVAIWRQRDKLFQVRIDPDRWRAMFPTLFLAQGRDETDDQASHAEAVLAVSLAVADKGEQVRSQFRGALVEALTARLLARRSPAAAVRRERRVLFDGVPAEIHPYDVTVELPGSSEAFDCKWGARGINADVLHQLDDARSHALEEDETLGVALVVFDAERSCRVRLEAQVAPHAGTRLVALEQLDSLGRPVQASR